ncbi:MAG: polyprenyl synthetase family protein [Acidobacteriota bacterium]
MSEKRLPLHLVVPPSTGDTPAPRLPVALPRKMPRQRDRAVQSNIPGEPAVRERMKRVAADLIAREGIVPPLSMADLVEAAGRVITGASVPEIYIDFAAVLVNNAVWRESLAGIPYDRRLLLLPKCLRVEESCPAPFDEFGLLCKQCGLCTLHDLTQEADRLGYAVLVAEGSAIVRQMIETGRIEAIIGVSCLNVLEKCFPHMEATAIPGMSVPLLQDDCINTTVDMEWVWDLIHLTSEDRTYRLDLDALKGEVADWLGPRALTRLMGPVRGETEQIARQWLARAGKRWRPYLTACAYLALQEDASGSEPVFPQALKKIAVAVECFHKASLIHDDIEDGEATRYDKATLHTEHGVPVALNVGDFLVGEGYRLIAEAQAPAAITSAMLREAAIGHVTLCRGQGAELCWTRRREPLSSMDVLEIFREKTAPAFEVALRLGARLAGADETILSVLSSYSESLGIAYQIRDDLDDHAGAGDSHDLRDLRPSLLLAIAHRRTANGPDHEVVAALWRGTVSYETVAADISRILTEQGVIDKADELLDAYKEQAIRSLSPLTSPTLKGLLRRVIGKIYGEHLIEGYCSEFEARNAAGREARTETAS